MSPALDRRPRDASLDVRDLVVRFPSRASGGPREFLAVDGVCVRAHAARLARLVGESGSGKSKVDDRRAVLSASAAG